MTWVVLALSIILQSYQAGGMMPVKVACTGTLFIVENNFSPLGFKFSPQANILNLIIDSQSQGHYFKAPYRSGSPFDT